MAVRALATGRARPRIAASASGRGIDRFIAGLAEGGQAQCAADAAGVTLSDMLDLRRSSADFAARWQGALDDHYLLLEHALLQRLRLGEARFDKAGKALPPLFDNANALRLLLARRPAQGALASEDGDDAAAARASLRGRIDRLVALIEKGQEQQE